MRIRSFFLYVFVFLSFTQCVELYDFELSDRDVGLVVESFISNQSYSDTYLYPSDGRFFSVVLSYTTDVDNVLASYVSYATVRLQDDLGDYWDYTESPDEVGHYYLYDAFFKADLNRKYQLEIVLPDGEIVKSEWESLPVASTELGSLDLVEEEKEVYTYQNDSRIIETLKGIELSIEVSDTNELDNIFYKWDFDPLWIFDAPYLASPNMPLSRCWVRNEGFMSDYKLKEVQGETSQDLFFIETIGNERVYNYFSVLITQQVISEGYYNFWSEMKGQNSQGGLFDEPPFSLKTNYVSSDSSMNISGYFGVVTENATRWVFDSEELSYIIENDLVEECDANICLGGPCPPPSCSNCLLYIWGETTEQAPSWW